MKVGLFIPCYINAVYPGVGRASYELLSRLGCEVDYPLGQTCCRAADGQCRVREGRPGAGRTHGCAFCAVRLRGRAFGQLRGFRARGLSAVVGQLPRACLRRFAYLGDLRVHPRRGEAREAGCTFPAPGERAQLLPRGAQNGAVIAQRAERALYVEAARPALAGRGHRHRRAIAPR